MSEALPKSLHLFAVSVANRFPSMTTKLASISDPPKRIFAFPDAAVAGVVVRSPVNTFSGSPGTLPFTVSTTCALLTFLLDSADCLTNVVASGRGPPLGLEPEEQPATRAVAMLSVARTANRR
jgi:hypothetical protein